MPANAVPGGGSKSAVNGGDRTVWADSTARDVSARKNATCAAWTPWSGHVSRTTVLETMDSNDTCRRPTSGTESSAG